ncbi:MAG TPA: ATP-dependent RecD-like DNA helicase, partial [Verrucomicrobia bacterium]|nr:ATP-dependent RecD-like DNA helicase [Verrucomicrobiota bacterium]
LMAPTGRAAKRLSESAQLPAQTLHRGLGFQPHTRQFNRDAEHPLEADMVIVDEVSMLDQVLAYHLIKAIAHGTRLVLVGDPDQLPSVGPGNVLSDLIRSEICPVITLNQVFRQSGGSRILHSAHAIRKGEIPDLKNHPKADFFFMSREDPNEIANTIVELAIDRLPRHFHLDPFTDIQVLSPMHRGPCGVEHLNELIEERLLGRDTPGILRYGRLWRRRAKVMQTRNNYDQEVFNGDIGFVSDVNTIDQNVSVTMDGREVVYPFQDLDELVPAYAISVHKSQGSEYPAVIVPVSMQHRLMLRRNLIYTAVTRAKRILILVGAPKALRMAVETVDHEHTRCTGLRFRLQADLATGGTTIAPESELLQEEY